MHISGLLSQWAFVLVGFCPVGFCPSGLLSYTRYLEGGPLMWVMYLHVNQKSDYEYDDDDYSLDCFRSLDQSDPHIWLNKICFNIYM